MSLLFDQNLSRRLPGRLATEFPGSEHVITVGLTDASDREVWDYAGANGLTIVSKDTDFRELVNQLGGPPKVVILHVGNGNTNVVETLLRHSSQQIGEFLQDPTASLLELP